MSFVNIFKLSIEVKATATTKDSNEIENELVVASA